MSALIDAGLRIADRERMLVAIERYVLEEGKLTFLFGESGIGKTLAAKAVCGLLDADALEVSVDGRPYSTYLSSVSARIIREKGFFVFQEPSSHLNPLRTIGDQLREGTIADRSAEADVFEQLWPRERAEDVPKLLELYPEPTRPSGGEKQRMLLAMAFKKLLRSMNDVRSRSGLFVFDEPTGSLDDLIRDRFLRYILTLFSGGRFTGLIMTHDYSMVSVLMRSSEAMKRCVVLKELVRRNGFVAMRDYAPAEYADWVKDLRIRSPRPASDARLLATVKSGTRVHGRTLMFSSDRDGRSETRLDIRSGRVTYLKAPSGTGKTTIAKAMLGLVAAQKLAMRLGHDVLTEKTPLRYWQTRLLGKRITMAFQHADEALSMQSGIPDVFDALPRSARRDEQSLRELLGHLFEPGEIESFPGRRVRTLSGGQKQRLNILRCLLLDASVVILDEPLNGLDLESAKRVLALIWMQKERGKGFLVISHNEEIFDAEADATVYLQHAESEGMEVTRKAG